MSRLVLDQVVLLAPPDKKQTGSGWVSFNGSCCIHNGERRPDTRKRAGIRLTEDSSTVYHCFNCHYTASWRPGQLLSKRMKNLLGWMGMSVDDIRKLNFKVWQIRETANADESPKHERRWTLKFGERSLPEGAQPFEHWLAQENPPQAFLDVVEYVADRGEDILMGCRYYWSPDPTVRNRVIIPFYWQDQLVGWTARAVKHHRVRYMSEVQPNFIFNNRVMTLPDRKFITLVEGPFDAIAIDGIATLGGTVTPQQAEWINNCGKQVIVVPDREHTGHGLADAAIQYGWHVSYSDWESDIKDVADAVKRYGRLYSLMSIMEARTSDRIRINMLKKRYSK